MYVGITPKFTDYQCANNSYKQPLNSLLPYICRTIYDRDYTVRSGEFLYYYSNTDSSLSFIVQLGTSHMFLTKIFINSPWIKLSYIVDVYYSD